jgi:hypothetical protein
MPGKVLVYRQPGKVWKKADGRERPATGPPGSKQVAILRMEEE